MVMVSPTSSLGNILLGCNWLTWTERLEEKFQTILLEARAGKGMPKALAAWKSELHGQQFACISTEHNESRSKVFMDKIMPVAN